MLRPQEAFQSRLPARGAALLFLFYEGRPLHFNPRSPHGERHCESCNQPCLTTFQSTLPARGATFAVPKNVRRSKFQSTLPARGATCIAEWRITHVAHFNPRSPHGERLRQAVGYIRRQISIHAPRTGSDAKGQVYPNRQAYFNPRSPHGERPSRIAQILSN